MAALKYDNFLYYTYEDYKYWEDSWEIIDGIPYAMSPAPYPKHGKQPEARRLAQKAIRSVNQRTKPTRRPKNARQRRNL